MKDKKKIWHRASENPDSTSDILLILKSGNSLVADKHILYIPDLVDRWAYVSDLLLMDEWADETMIAKACDTYCKVCGHYAHSVPMHICRQDCDYYSRFLDILTPLK